MRVEVGEQRCAGALLVLQNRRHVAMLMFCMHGGQDVVVGVVPNRFVGHFIFSVKPWTLYM